MNKSNPVRYLIICTGVLMLLTTSCVPFSKIKYFNDINQLSEPVVNPMSSIKISPFDRLRVLVLSTDKETSAILNYSSGQNVTTGPAISYVVDATGFITFPYAGKIQVGGLTLVEAGEVISTSLKNIITNPEVFVTLVDPKITLIGEVFSQGSFPMSKEFLSIYEAVALGGGLTQFADRKNIILLRNENNKLTHYILNLNNSKITSSPLYYILPNDVIIIEPIRNKSWNMQSSTWMTVLSAISSLLSIYYMTSFTLRY